MNRRVIVAPCCGPDVHLPIQVIGRRRVGWKLLCSAIVAVDFRMADSAQLAAANESFPRLEEMGRAATLESNLHGPLIFSGSSHHGLTFDHVVTYWFLDVHIRTALARVDRRQAV